MATESKSCWLTVDPGEETGFSVWRGTELIYPEQEKLWPFLDEVDAWLSTWAARPDRRPELFGGEGDQGAPEPLRAIVCEDWALYPRELQNLGWDKCRTARGIGALELLARQNHIAFYLQPASIKDAAVAAGAEELFCTPLHENRHMNDAIMHGTYYLAKNGKPPC